MLAELKNWLLRPFPFVESYRQAVAISLIVGVFVTLFLVVFQPFGIDRLSSNLILYMSGYGLISFWCVYFVLQVFPTILPKWFDESRWNVFKNILMMVLILLLVSIFNWIYGLLLLNISGLHQNEERVTTFLGNVFMTVSVGVFPVLIISYIIEKQLFARNQKLAHSLKSTIEGSLDSTHIDKQLEIPADGKTSYFISSSDLICIKAEGGNYVTAYWREKDKIRNQLWRTTLKNVISEVESDESILQCHKSYLINSSFINEVTGNARTLIIYLKGLDFEIPVSRSFPRELVERFHLQRA